MISTDDIQEAAARLAPVLRKTPIEHVHAVSRAVNRDLWIKEEQLQRTGSYKIRGAYNLVSRLPAGEPIVTASSGNHAQGVALAASLTQRVCEIYMPRRSPLPKVEATEAYGAKVIPVEGDLETCQAHALGASQDSGAHFVPTFDDPHLIAGHGTVGLELAKELPSDIKTVVVPIGAGALAAGVAVAIKTLRPEMRVVGVEAAGAPGMSRSLREGQPVRLARMATIADSLAVREVGEMSFEHVQRYVDEVVLVTEAEISHALLILLERAKAVIEPGAAASVAAMLAGEVTGKDPACAVLTGGNVDPVLLMKLIDQGLTSSGRFTVIHVTTTDDTGQLANMARIVADLGINITDISQQRSGHHIEANQVQVEMTLETRNRFQQDDVLDALENSGFHAEVQE